MNWFLLSQIAIPVLGVVSCFLTARKNKWTYVVSLSAQPAWFYSAITAKQWGLVVSCAIYSVIFVYGGYKWWGLDKKWAHRKRMGMVTH